MKGRSITQAVLRRILSVQRTVNPSHFSFQCLLYLLFLLWGLSFFDETDFSQTPKGPSAPILDNINLIFHEAGHVIFQFFGGFPYAFGGTFLQCLIPFLLMRHFLIQKDNFAASLGLWWLAQNIFNVSPYLYDAWDMKLVLLGGQTGTENPDIHDWRAILTMTNSLKYYAEISSFIVLLGKFFFCCSFLWGGIILYKKFLIIRGHFLNF